MTPEIVKEKDLKDIWVQIAMNRRDFFKILFSGVFSLLLGGKALNWKNVVPISRVAVDLGELEPVTFIHGGTWQFGTLPSVRSYSGGEDSSFWFNGDTTTHSNFD